MIRMIVVRSGQADDTVGLVDVHGQSDILSVLGGDCWWDASRRRLSSGQFAEDPGHLLLQLRQGKIAHHGQDSVGRGEIGLIIGLHLSDRQSGDGLPRSGDGQGIGMAGEKLLIDERSRVSEGIILLLVQLLQDDFFLSVQGGLVDF